MVAEMSAAHSSALQQENVPSSAIGTIQRPKLEEECSESSSTLLIENANGPINEQQFGGIGTEENEGRTTMGGEGGMKTENLGPSLELFLCTNCGLPIHDRFLYQVLDQQFYHEKCLHCSVCSEPFAGAGSCFSRNQLLFCRDHFFATFGPKCARCSAPIGERTVVRRANQHIYHLDCFQCIVCKRELNTGDQFYLIPMDGRLVCRQDFENAQKESAEMDCGNKRPRTTISAKSLETLKQAYQCSSKPARHVREQLATQTGLDMRVVQVWFQNRRAKEKRLKKDANRRWAAQNGGGGDGRSGSNGTATGGNGSGPGSVPSSSGMHGMLFGRAGTLDSDSGASNNDAESPIYSIYTNPSDGDIDANSSTEIIYPDQNAGIFHGVPTSDPSSAAGQSQQSQAMSGQNGQQGSGISALMPGLKRQHSEQQMSPHQQQTPPGQPQQQLYTLEQLEGGPLGAGGIDPRTPIAASAAQIAMGIGTGISSHSQPGTPQQSQIPPQMAQNGHQQIFSPQMICGDQSDGGNGPNAASLLSDQQYLLAAAFGPPPPQMPQMGQFMMAAMPPPPDSAFYHPSMGPPIGHQMGPLEGQAHLQGHPLAPSSHPHPHHFSPISMQIMHQGHYQNGQPISQ